MNSDADRLIETVTLRQAKALIHCAAQEQSFLLLSPPGVGKSDMVAQAAAEAGLVCRSLLGTQIAPEDVSGVPTIVGERSAFCPPRMLLPESPDPFCLFLDELPACAPDIQKAFYALLLERRLGEHKLPPGSWVVASGNRTEDRALVRTISSALVNRVVMLQIRVDHDEWAAWAAGAGVRREVTTFIKGSPASLLRLVPSRPVPFSTPRAWASLSRALDLTEQAGILDETLLRALSQGRVSREDADPFCAWWEITHRATEAVASVGLSQLLNMSVRDMGLSVRATHALESAGIATLRELVALSEFELRRVRSFDQARVQEVMEKLAEKGLRLGMALRPNSTN